MSQEEIESLMNGLDIDDGEDSNEEPIAEENFPEGNMSEEDINNLIAQTEDISTNVEMQSSEESVDDLLNSLDNIESENDSADETNIDDILKELEENDNEVLETEKKVDNFDDIIKPNAEEIKNSNIDDILSTIDDMESGEIEPEETKLDDDELELEENIDSSSITDKNIEVSDLDQKINSGLFPLPVEDDTKVVNQLSEVATDSEEKATKIFDVLSNILDYNNNIQSDVQALNGFNEKQIAMLTSLSQKFPNIDVFKENLNQAQLMGNHINDVNEKLNEGNTEIFQAMELMQYHDINRQKIERVMSVIRNFQVI